MKYKAFLRFSLIAAVALTERFLAAADIEVAGGDQVMSEAIDISGEYEIFVANGATLTCTGQISGSGAIFKRGEGVLVLKNSGNSFEGGMRIACGIVRADAEGCLGTGAIIFDDDDVYKEGSVRHCPLRQLRFNAEGATFPNDITIAGYDPASNTIDYAYIIADASATLLGAIAFEVGSDDGMYRHIISAGTASNPSPKLTVKGPVSFPGGYLRVAPWGTMEFAGAVSVDTLNVGFNANLAGTLTLSDPGNSISKIMNNGAIVRCTADGALGGAEFIVSATYPSQTKSSLDLCATRQRCKVLRYNNDNLAVQGTYVVSTGGPGHITLTGASANRTTRNIFSGDVTLVLDPENESFKNTFSSRENTMTGHLCVSNGVMAIENGARFANVPQVHVGEKGTLTLSGANAAFAEVTNLVVDGKFAIDASAQVPFSREDLCVSIGENGNIDIPEATLIVAEKFFVGGNRMADKTYTASDNVGITGAGGIKVAGKDMQTVQAAWTGEGASDDSVFCAENWSGATLPDFGNAALVASFAIGGTSASFPAAASFYGLELSAESGFAFRASAPEARMEIGLGGIAIAGAEEGAISQYSFHIPVFLSNSQTWAIPSGSTMSICGGLETDAGVKVQTEGSGLLELSGTNTFAGAFVRNNAITAISGLLATPGHIDQGEVAANPSEGHLNATFDCSEQGGIVFGGAIVEKPLYLRGRSHNNSSKDVWCAFGPGSTNEFRGHVRAASPVGDVQLGEGSVAKIFNKCNFDGGVYFYGSGAFVVEEGNLNAASGFGVYMFDSVKMVLKTRENRLKLTILGGELDCRVDYAITNQSIYCDSGAPTVKLNNTRQHVNDLHISDRRSLVSGEYPATLKVGNMVNYGYFGGNVQGWVGIEKCGTGTLTLTNNAFASTGDLKVSKGMLVLGANASWKEGTNVTVTSSGTLSLEGDRQLNAKFAVLRISDSGVVKLSDNARHRVSQMWIGGSKIPNGVYGGLEAPDFANKEYRQYFAGKGTLRVGDGFTLVIR